MRQDICDYCRKPVNEFDGDALVGTIDLRRQRDKSALLGWLHIKAGQNTAARVEGAWCNRNCLVAWIDKRLKGGI